MIPDETEALRTTEVVRLVAGREIGERLRAKSFYALTGLLVVAILALGALSQLAGDDGPAAVDVGITGPVSAELEQSILQTAELFERGAEVTSFDDGDAARAALEDDDIDVAVIAEENQAVFADAIDQQTLAILQQAWSSVQVQRSLADAGLDEDQILDALSTAPLEATTADGDDDNDLAMLTGTLAAILLFISLQTFGNYVLVGVVEEKSTAVIEVLLARARADQMLAGKVIGIGVAAMAQFALAVAAGVVSLLISGVDVPGEIWAAVPMTLIWFLLGYALYSTLFALAGSLVSRQEDAQAASAPILTLLLGAYMLVFFFGFVPDSTASTVMSMIPPLAPLLMPMRMAAGAASWVEVMVALVLLVGAILASWKLTGKIYEQVLLRRGTRISWREAAKLLR